MKTSQQILQFIQKKHQIALESDDALLKSVYEDIILFIIQTPMPEQDDERDWKDLEESWDYILDKMNEQKADEQINYIKSQN